MPRFSKKSLDNLFTCNRKLREISFEAIKTFDFTVICGHRSKAEQNRLYEIGMSKVKWPNSKHNVYPSEAIDIAPYPIDWNDINRFFFLAGILKYIAYNKGILLRWGGDFNMDNNFSNDSFLDYGHFELLEKKH